MLVLARGRTPPRHNGRRNAPRWQSGEGSRAPDLGVCSSGVLSVQGTWWWWSRALRQCTSVLSSPLQQHWWVGVKAGVRAGCACAEHAVVARCHHLSLEITSPLFCWSWRRLTLYEKSEAELTIPSRFLVCLSSFPGSKLFLDKAKQQSCSSRWQQGSILPLERYPQWSMKTL